MEEKYLKQLASIALRLQNLDNEEARNEAHRLYALIIEARNEAFAKALVEVHGEEILHG